MSKRCPDCGFINEDARIYCAACGEPLDPKLRLIKDLDRQTSGERKAAPEPPPPPPSPKPKIDDGDETLSKIAHEKKFNPVPWIILGVIVAAAVVLLIVLS